MFLRCHTRKKDGKQHRYYSVEESRRLQPGKVVQRRVLYLGEINDSQQASWRKTLEVFSTSFSILMAVNLVSMRAQSCGTIKGSFSPELVAMPEEAGGENAGDGS